MAEVFRELRNTYNAPFNNPPDYLFKSNLVVEVFLFFCCSPPSGHREESEPGGGLATAAKRRQKGPAKKTREPPAMHADHNPTLKVRRAETSADFSQGTAECGGSDKAINGQREKKGYAARYVYRPARL